MKKTSEVLDKAADLIEEHGWGTGPSTWSVEGHGLCLEGGLAAALGMDPYDRETFSTCPAYRAVEDYLRASGEWGGENDVYIYEWNDDRNRTAEQVTGLLREVASVERERELVSA